MKYVIADEPTFHHDLPFIRLHYTYAPFTSSSQFTSLTFTSLHFIAFLMIPPHLHSALFIIFLTLFLKLLGLQERDPKTSAGSWFQRVNGPIYKEIFSDICLLLSAPNFPIMIDPAQIAWAL
jgi:hypothetical protein